MTNFLKNQIIKEIAISLIILAIYHLLLMVPLPFINLSEFNTISESFGSLFFGNDHFSHIAITTLGIMPFVSAYLMVEILSLFIPFLKKHRGGDYYGRNVLLKYALILTFVLSVIQGKFIIQGLEGMVSPSGIPILVLTNNLQFFALLSTLVATVFLILYLADIVTKHGIGNGISLLILSGICVEIIENISFFFDHTSKIQLNFFYVILFSLIAFFLFMLIPILLLKTSSSIPLQHKYNESPVNFFKLSSCLSGKVAIGHATSILMLPITLMSFRGGLEPITRSLEPGTFGYYFLSCILVVFLSYFFGWLFLHPKGRFKTLKVWGWYSQKTHQDNIGIIKQKFLFMNLPWSLFLCGVAILPSIAISGFNIPFYIGGSSLFIVAVLSLDIASRFKLWNENVRVRTIKIAEFQDLHYATMIKNHLQDENIKFYLQGYYHRHLLYFFGPYIPINLMVPAFEKNRASALITRYYGELGLIKVEKPCQAV